MMLLLVGAAELAEECHVNLAEHVKRGDSGTYPQKRPQPGMAAREAVPDDRVLRHKAGERWDGADRERRGKKRPKRDRQALAYPAHHPHVLHTAHRMDHRPRTEKQAAFEKRVRHQVKDAVDVSARTARSQHVPKRGT